MYRPMICLFDIAQHTFTLGEFIVALMVTQGLVAAQIRQLCLLMNSEMKKQVVIYE